MRKFCFLLLLFFAIGCKVKQMSSVTEPTQIDETKLALVEENTAHLWDNNLAPFYHGVASGDPYENSVVIWTRVTAPQKMEEIEVTWEVSLNKDFIELIQFGNLSTNSSKDYTVKTIVPSLEPGTSYYYRFQALGSFSMTGKTKTLPSKDAKIKLAVASCSNIEFGYFNAYAAMCNENVDAVIHLGDYIYEYGDNVYGDTSFHRKNIPPREIISLQDYRDRYSQYRLDEDLRKAHANIPFINIWDDHEITNNAYVEGAQNHQKDEGSYTTRKEIAKQVFYEWLPIRETENHYRKFRFGNTMELFMLDERLAGRTMQADSISDPRRFSEEQKLLGDEQMDWLIESLNASTATWKVLGNQVIFSYLDWGYKGFSQNMDAWDGYPNDQIQFTEAVVNNGIKNLVFVTGDTHTAWAFEATNDPFDSYNKSTGNGAIGIEFGVTSITSGNANERTPTDEVKKHEAKIVKTALNPHLKYTNMRDHGYLVLSLDKKQVKAEFKILQTLKDKDDTVTTDKLFIVKSGRTKLFEE